ncbi:MAG: hypothetical protein ABSD82_00345 [Solirubrobacteraceae bacterium]|jgi:uncharacterized membrane protein
MFKRAAGPFFVVAGALHFVIPDSYAAMMPRYLPVQRELVYASGVAEIAGGAALMHSGTRAWAGWWLIATLLAVFPANLNMALHPERYAAHVPGGRSALIARLPLQAVLIAWVHAAATDRSAADRRPVDAALTHSPNSLA